MINKIEWQGHGTLVVRSVGFDYCVEGIVERDESGNTLYEGVVLKKDQRSCRAFLRGENYGMAKINFRKLLGDPRSFSPYSAEEKAKVISNLRSWVGNNGESGFGDVSARDAVDALEHMSR